MAAVGLMATVSWSSISEAAFFSFPRQLRHQLSHISFVEPALAPMAHTMFCLRYTDDCQVHGSDFRKRNIALTEDRLHELDRVNREVNRAIAPQVNRGGLAAEQWLLSPPAGDCNDYAVTKRHQLLQLGWPSRALLLSEVVIPSGEHHLVLVVRAFDRERMRVVDLVLDNLTAQLRPVALVPYQWVRVESPTNPKFWSTVSVPSRLRTAALRAAANRDAAAVANDD
jgi:predicted transglutaminase-like cysteine proteinase